MNQPATKQEDQICYHGTEPIGVRSALEAILNHAAKQHKPKPIQFPVDYYLTEVIREGKPVKIQIEVTEYCPPHHEEWYEFGEKGLQEQEWDAEASFGKCYTADDRMVDVELTQEEWDRIYPEYLEKKSRNN